MIFKALNEKANDFCNTKFITSEVTVASQQWVKRSELEGLQESVAQKKDDCLY